MLKKIACAAALTLAIAVPAAAQQHSGKGTKIRYQVYQSTAEVLMRA